MGNERMYSMKYTVKWLEDNLGITRNALRNYEATYPQKMMELTTSSQNEKD